MKVNRQGRNQRRKMKALRDKLESEIKILEAEILKEGLNTHRLDLLIRLEKAIHHLPVCSMDNKKDQSSIFGS